MKRRTLVVVGGVVGVGLLAAAGVIAWLVLSVDGIVAREIERAGTQATGTRVSVAGVNVTLKEASGTIRSLRVANPAGFSAAAVLDADSIRFDLDESTLRDDVLVVEEVRISRPRLRFEVSSGGKANLDALAKSAAAATDDPDASPRRVRIRRFVIEDGALRADASAMRGKEEEIALRDIVLRDVGGRDGGTGDEIAAEVVAAVRKEVMRAVTREGFQRYLSGAEGDVRGKARKKLEGLLGR